MTTNIDLIFKTAQTYQGELEEYKALDEVIILMMSDLQALASHYGIKLPATNQKPKSTPIDARFGDEITSTMTSFSYNTIINGEHINEEVFNLDMVVWRLEERKILMNNLISAIAAASNKTTLSKMLSVMKQDLLMLAGLNDEYVWFSMMSNAYISPSRNPDKFNEICCEVLAAHYKFMEW